MFRGISSFNHADEDLTATPTPSKGSTKRKQSNSISNSKNPYSSRGLEKFTSVLSELEARKEKIMARTGSDGDATIVRFKYSKSQDWVPIVVKLRENNNCNPVSPKKTKPKEMPPMTSPQVPLSPKVKEAAQPEIKAVKKSVTWSEGEVGKRRAEWWKLRPSYYLMAVMLLILLCLVMSGRVFAICCTAVWWYLVPKFMGADDEGGKTRRRSSSNKDYVRKQSDKRLPSTAAAAAGGGALSQAKQKGGGVVQESASPRANVNHGKRG